MVFLLILSSFAFTSIYSSEIKQPTIQIILGSTRQGRYSDKVANATLDSLKDQKNVSFEVIDLKSWDLPFFDSPISPSRGKIEDIKVQKFTNKIKEANGYIIITPEYNHSYPAVLKNALDYIYHEWNGKPVMVIGYSAGKKGGVYATNHLKDVFKELKFVQLSDVVNIPSIHQKIGKDFKFLDENIIKQVKLLFEELINKIKKRILI